MSFRKRPELDAEKNKWTFVGKSFTHLIQQENAIYAMSQCAALVHR